MGYYRGGRKRSNPAAEERRERERLEQEKFVKDRESLNELLSNFRKVHLRESAARAAWTFPEKRSFTIGKTSDGSRISYILRGDDENEILYLQEPHFPAWRFYRLDPKYNVVRQEDEWSHPESGYGYGGP